MTKRLIYHKQTSLQHIFAKYTEHITYIFFMRQIEDMFNVYIKDVQSEITRLTRAFLTVCRQTGEGGGGQRQAHCGRSLKFIATKWLQRRRLPMSRSRRRKKNDLQESRRCAVRPCSQRDIKYSVVVVVVIADCSVTWAYRVAQEKIRRIFFPLISIYKMIQMWIPQFAEAN